MRTGIHETQVSRGEFGGNYITPSGGSCKGSYESNQAPTADSMGGAFSAFTDENNRQRCVRRGSMPILRILYSSVVRGTPRRTAAPSGPPTVQLVCSNTARMCSRAAVSSVQDVFAGDSIVTHLRSVRVGRR